MSKNDVDASNSASASDYANDNTQNNLSNKWMDGRGVEWMSALSAI